MSLWHITLPLAGAVLLSSCVAPPAVKPAPMLDARAVGIEQGGAQRFSARLTPDWWIGFGDTRLTAIIETALAGSPSLRLVQARMQQAGASVELAQADAGPRVGAGADARRQRFSANGLVPAALAGATRSLANLQADASWELDFFGRHDAALAQALGQQQAARAEAHAARVLLTTDIARQYLQLARLIEERLLLREQLNLRNSLTQAIERRLSQGLETRLELRQAQTPTAGIRQRLEAIDGQMSAARHALAALAAQPPETYAPLEPRLEGLRAIELPREVPADLLGQRADLTASRWRVEASAQAMAAARAEFYPNINLTALAGLSAIGLDRLFSTASRQYAVGPAIHLPVFDAGRLRARHAHRAAELDTAIETYNQALYVAVREVLDQIGLIKSAERQRVEQTAAAVAAQGQLEVQRARFARGLSTRLSTLLAELTVLDQQFNRLDLDTRSLDAHFALIRALGGGYRDEAPSAAGPASSDANPSPIARSPQ